MKYALLVHHTPEHFDNRNNAAFGDPLIDVYAAPLRLAPSQLPSAQH